MVAPSDHIEQRVVFREHLDAGRQGRVASRENGRRPPTTSSERLGAAGSGAFERRDGHVAAAAAAAAARVERRD